MFGEYIEDKQIYQVYRHDGIMGRNKYHLLSKLVNYDQDSVKSREWWKFLNEVHRNRIPWSFGDRKLFERSIGLVILWLKSHTSNIGLAELLYISTEAGPEISMTNQFQCFVLTKVSDKGVIMIILENICVEITSRWYMDSVINKEKTVWVHRPLAIYGDVFCSNWITRKS